MDNTLEKQDTITFINFFKTWFQPRSTDRDEIFREQVIRIAVAGLTIVGILNVFVSVFISNNPWSIVSLNTVYLVALLPCLAAGVAIVRDELVWAGWLLLIAPIGGLVFLSLLRIQEAGYYEAAIDSLYALPIIPILAALILPRKYIMVVTILTPVLFSLALFGFTSSEILMPDFAVSSHLVSLHITLILMGFLLYRFRVEFDARLTNMYQSLDETAAAKEKAEIAQKRAEEADKAKSQFLANMSHELRTPLNAIIGYDEAMLGGMVGEFTPKQHQLLGHIQYNSRRLLGLINDVLDLAKIESGSLQVYSGPLSPQSVFTRTIESVKSLAEEKSVELELSVDKTTPELIISDEKKLEQIIINIVGNAIKFTETGGVYVTVAGLDKDNWQFSIRDTGMGIARDQLEEIFNPFQQVDNSSTRKFKGTGLGLSITKRLVEILSGKIEVDSELGKGTTFTITLPRTVQNMKTQEEQIQQAKSKAQHPIT